KELARALDVPTHEYRDFKQLLHGLEQRGRILRTRGNRYALTSNMDVVPGIVSLTRRGDGFIRPSEGGEDVYVPGGWLNTAMDGDRVAVRIERRPRGRNPEGRVIRVLERARETIVGPLHRGRQLAYVTPPDPRLDRDVPGAPDDEPE